MTTTTKRANDLTPGDEIITEGGRVDRVLSVGVEGPWRQITVALGCAYSRQEMRRVFYTTAVNVRAV